MKRYICILTVIALVFSCAFAHAEEGNGQNGRVKILSCMTMKVPNGHSATISETNTRVFPYSGEEDRDSVMEVYFYKDGLSGDFMKQLEAETLRLDAALNMDMGMAGRFSFNSSIDQKNHKSAYQTVMGIKQCLVDECVVNVKTILNDEDYLMICVFIDKDGGTYCFFIRSPKESRAREMMKLLETVEWTN